MNIQITQRDRDILSDIFEHKLFSRDRLKEKYFNKTSIQTFHSRIAKLIKNGLIEKKMIHSHSTKLIYYSLNKKGWNAISEDYSDTNEPLYMDSYAPIHDENLIFIKSILVNTDEHIQYWTEVLLKSLNDENCLSKALLSLNEINADGAIKIQLDGEKLYGGIEYERSRKSNQRLIKKYMGYLKNDFIDLCFFILDNQKEEDKARKVLSDMSHSQYKKILFSNLEKLKINNLTFKNNNNMDIIFTPKEVDK